MDFESQGSMSSHLLTVLKKFWNLKQRDAKSFVPVAHLPLLNEVPKARGLRVLQLSHPSVIAGPFQASVSSRCAAFTFFPSAPQVRCLPPHGATGWAANKTQVYPQQVPQGCAGAEGMVRYSQCVCLQLFCPSVTVSYYWQVSTQPWRATEAERKLALEGWWDKHNIGCKDLDCSWRSIKGCRWKLCWGLFFFLPCI